MASRTDIEPSTKPALVSFVVINWNGEHVIEDCLNSILALKYPIQEIIVSDNGSTDRSVAIMRSKYPDKVKILEIGRNAGVSVARNVGLRRALEIGSDFIFCLDNDLTIAPDAIDRLLEVMARDPKIVMAQALILDLDAPDTISSAGGIINWSQNLVNTLGRDQKSIGQFRDIWDVDYAGGGALLLRAGFARKHGIIDESFIGYGYEDTDYGMRAKKLGYRVVCCADAKVWHRPHTGIGRYSFKKKYLETRNAVRFIKRYGDFSSWCKYLFYLSLGLIYALFKEGSRGNLPGVIGKLRGFVDGLFGREDFAYELLNKPLATKGKM